MNDFGTYIAAYPREELLDNSPVDRLVLQANPGIRETLLPSTHVRCKYMKGLVVRDLPERPKFVVALAFSHY